MYCKCFFPSSAVGDGLLFLIYFSPNPLSSKAPTITVQVHASLSKKIRFFSSYRSWPRRLPGKFIGGRRQFLVYLIRTWTRFLPLLGWFPCTMAWECCISMNDTRHAIPPSYGESEERFDLTRICIDTSQFNAGHLEIWLLDFLCLMLESLSRSNPVPASAISKSTPTSPLGSVLTCLFRVGVKGIGGRISTIA
jgi:hypothetical protein